MIPASLGGMLNDLGAPIDLAVEPFDRIGAVQFGTMRRRKSHAGEDIGFHEIGADQRRGISASSPAKAVAMKAETMRR